MAFSQITGNDNQDEEQWTDGDETTNAAHEEKEERHYECADVGRVVDYEPLLASSSTMIIFA
jgi:hypothetical protein